MLKSEEEFDMAEKVAEAAAKAAEAAAKGSYFSSFYLAHVSIFWRSFLE